MFDCLVSEKTALRPVELPHAEVLFQLIEVNRAHLRRWHPWVDILRRQVDVARAIVVWQQQSARRQGFFAGIWHEEKLCGLINHLHVDWTNRQTALSFWLAESHQRRGIMTDACRAFIRHNFEQWQLHRVTIECATENLRSRALTERLGFKLEGIVREAEWLHDRFVDHAVYGLLKTDPLK